MRLFVAAGRGAHYECGYKGSAARASPKAVYEHTASFDAGLDEDIRTGQTTENISTFLVTQVHRQVCEQLREGGR